MKIYEVYKCRHKRYGSKQPSATCYNHTDRSQSAKVGTQWNRVNSKGTESTPNQQVSEVTQLSITSLPIVHLSILQENSPWTLLLKMGMVPLAAELYTNNLYGEDHLIPVELDKF